MDHEEKAAVIARRRIANSLQPVNQLPQEVLSEILSLSLEPAYRGPWGRAVLRVCHDWRACLLRIPSVWGRLYITEMTSVEELDVWLSRASRVLLHVTLQFKNEESAAHVHSMWSRIATHPIKSFNLHYGYEFNPSWIFPLYGQIATLEEFATIFESSEGLRDTPSIFGPVLPLALTSLTITDEFDAGTYRLDDLHNLNVSDLRHVQLAMPLRDSCSFLSRCSALKSFKNDVYRAAETEDLSKGPLLLSFPELESLDLKGQYWEAFLRRAHMPQLCQLGLDLGPSLRRMPDTVQITTVQRLHLTRGCEVSKDLLLNFSELKYLKLLDLAQQDIPTLRILTGLVSDARQGKRFICPKLEELEYNTGGSWAPCLDLFRPLVLARVRGWPNPLTIYLPYLERPEGDEWEDWMDHLQFGTSSPLVRW